MISIVDDDATFRESIANVLRAHGHRAAAFGSAAEFLTSAERANTRCLILDVRMPDMSGPELERVLYREQAELPVIFVSALDDAAARALASESHAVAFLHKPCREADLLDAIARTVTKGPMTMAKYNEEYIESDGLRLFVRSWTPEQPRAVVAICHGFNSHSGYYVEYAEQLAGRGYAVFALDLRGRGKSDGERFYLSRFSQYVSDVGALITLAKSRVPKLPVFLLGHSAGGVVSCTYALENQAQLAGLICESFAFQVYAPDFALAALKGLSHLAPHAHVLRLPNAQFSRDPKLVAAMDADPLIANETQPTLTVAEMARADDRLKREFPQITLPVLILHGTKDSVTKPSGSEFFHEHAGSSDKTLLLYDGHFHDLLNDVGKEIVVRDINVWLDARLPKR